MTPTQLKQIRQTSNEDVLLDIPARNQNLTFNQLKILFINHGLTINNDTFIENLGLKTKDHQFNLMAELLSDNNDVSIKVVRFKGKDKTEMVNRNEFGFKCLFLALDQVIHLIESYNETRVKLNSYQREEEKLFDSASFKEAWLNACVHNEWSKLNPPAIYIFDDRIEIISTGSIEGKLSKEEFYKGVSKPVNKKLLKIFGQLGYVEQTGHGIPLIVHKYGEQAFDIMEHFICVTIPFNKNVSRDKLNIKESETYYFTDIEYTIIELMKNKPTITIEEIMRITSLSDSYIRKIIKSLKERNIIERHGSNKKGTWRVK